MPPSSLNIATALFLRSCCQLLLAVVTFPLRLCCEVMVWSVAFLTLPIRLLTALERERKLEKLLTEMQTQMDRLVWENKELEERLQAAHKDQKAMEAIFEEMEEEHEDALARIDLLEGQLQDLKEENTRLNECMGKSLWDKKAHDDEDRNVLDALTIDTNVGMSSWTTSGRNAKSSWSWETGKDEVVAQDIFKPTDPYSFSPQAVSTNLSMDEVLKRRRVVALHRSLFSLIMSLAVGVIVWKAETPCLPLVAALFIVVGLSMCSVVRFCSTIKNKPPSDAVALLSLNCFLLGTITSPILPTLAWMLVPQAVSLVWPVLVWFGCPA